MRIVCFLGRFRFVFSWQEGGTSDLPISDIGPAPTNLEIHGISALSVGDE